MSMQSLLSGNMTWLTIQSCWFSHSPKKKLESQLLPRGSLQLEPYHKTDTTGTTGARGVRRRYARAFDGVVPQLTNQPWKKANVWIALTFQEAGKWRAVAGSVRRACRYAGAGLQRGVGCCVVVAGAGEFCLCLLKLIEFKQRKQRRLSSLLKKNVSFYYNIVLSTVCHVIWWSGLWWFLLLE